MAKKARKPSTQNKKGNPPVVRRLREGRILSLEFFYRHGWLIFIAVVVVVALIGQRYTNHKKANEITKLEEKLASAKSDQMAAQASYMSLIRENEMRRLLRDNNIDLDYQEQPPFVISQ